MPSASLVPRTLPVSVADHSYLADLTDYRRQTLSALRQGQDTAAQSGEASLSTEGLWLRWGDSFTWGAGRALADFDAQADRRQYRYSVHVDPWTEGEVSLVKHLANKRAVTGEVRLLQAGPLLVLVNNGMIDYTPDGITWTHLAAPTGIKDVSVGPQALYTAGTQGVHSIPMTATALGAPVLVTATAHQMVCYNNGRLIAGQGNLLVELQHGTGTWVSVTIFTHPEVTFTWTLRSMAPNGFYAGGQASARSELWSVTPDPSGVLFVSGETVMLPAGERLLMVRFYVGYILIGTDRGFRLAQADATGITYGPLIEVGPMRDIAVERDRVWGTCYTPDGQFWGTVQLDLHTFTSPLTPAWALDVGFEGPPGTAHVTDPTYRAVPAGVARYLDQTWVLWGQAPTAATTYATVAANYLTYDLVRVGVAHTYLGLLGTTATGDGALWASAAPCEQTGHLETGEYGYGIPYPKTLIDVEVVWAPATAPNAVSVEWREPPSDIWTPMRVVEVEATGELCHGRFSFDYAVASSVELRIRLNSLQTCPTVRQWSMRATPKVGQAVDQVQLPLMLHEQVTGGVDANGTVRLDTLAEFQFLSSLARSQDIVDYVEGVVAYKAKVTGCELRPASWTKRSNAYRFMQATLVLNLQIIDA